MRKLTATLGGEQLELAATFGAASDLHEKVGDPLAIAREAQIEAMLSGMGQVYHPKWAFTVKNVPTILHIGIKAAGGKMGLDKVQELVADAGFLEAKAVALDYIAMIVTPKSQEALEDDGDAAPGE
jgi:hypothetical protein